VSVLVIGLALLALAFANALAREMSRPVRELSEAIGRVAAGDLGTRVRPSGAAEMSALAVSFNVMTARLEAARVSLQQAEREAAWREVARHLAHEIKNPLTAMRYALHRIQRRVEVIPEADRAAVATSVAAILREVQDLAMMAEQFSQYARRPEPLLEPLDLAVIAGDAAALEEPETMRVSGMSQGLAVRGDRVLLSRAVQNLMVNAREAGGPEALVEMMLAADDGNAVIEVLDRGPGLPPGPIERLFEPYVSTKNRGSGLGLSLVRDVALQHGGGVSLQNREGGGVVARLWMPLASDHSQEGAGE
jgi:nitrogen fixation/metabolism regulation signal transduction histidine kinase